MCKHMVSWPGLAIFESRCLLKNSSYVAATAGGHRWVRHNCFPRSNGVFHGSLVFSTAMTTAKQEPSFIVAGKQEPSVIYNVNHSRGKHQRAVEHTIETWNN